MRFAAHFSFRYVRARYYDPATAQFLTRDPAVASTRSSYGYTKGNPLNGADPTGLDPWWEDVGLGPPANSAPPPQTEADTAPECTAQGSISPQGDQLQDGGAGYGLRFDAAVYCPGAQRVKATALVTLRGPRVNTFGGNTGGGMEERQDVHRFGSAGPTCSTTFFFDVQPWKPSPYLIQAWGSVDVIATYADGSTQTISIGIQDRGVFDWSTSGPHYP